MNRNFSLMKMNKCFRIFVLLVAAASGIPGCEKHDKNPLIDNSVKTYLQTVKLSGSVSGKTDVWRAGRVAAVGKNGSLIATAQLQGNGHYELTIPAGTELPLVLKAYPDSSNEPDETQLEAVAVDPAVKKYDINPLSSAIAEKARALGGYSRENMVEAAMSSVAVPDANKTTGGFRGDPTKQYGGWH
jgi:hypothetical protein